MKVSQSELNLLISEKIFGLPNLKSTLHKDYCNNIGYAWEILEKLKENFDIQITKIGTTKSEIGWKVIMVSTNKFPNLDNIFIERKASEAICIAALCVLTGKTYEIKKD